MDETLSSNLAEQITALQSRVGLLEDALRSYGIVTSESTAESLLKQVPGARATISHPPQSSAVQQPSAPPSSATEPPRPVLTTQPHAADRSLESRIGSQWFNRIGILAVLIGMAWFLKLAIDNHWIGPLGRVLIGLLAGAGLIAWSERFQRHGYSAFSYSLKAVGSGILYLSLWAAFSLFHLLPAGVAFAAMVAVTAFNGFLSWREDSELLALYSIVGGLSTPVLVSTGGNHEVSLFSYLLILDLAVLILTMLRPWSRLLFGAFNGTAFFVVGWYLFEYHRQFGPTAFFLACFLFLFGLAPRLIRLDREEGRSSRWNWLTLVWVPLANAALTFFTFYDMLHKAGAEWAQPWLAVSFAGFYLLLLRLPARTPLRESPAVSSILHLTMAITFLSIAIPLKAHGRWLTIGWLIEGAALLWVASRAQVQRASPLVLRVLALLCLLLGLGALVLIDPPASITPLFNERFGTYLVAITVFIFTALVARRTAKTKRETDSRTDLNWTNIAAVAALLVNTLILLALGWEIHNYWWFVSWHGHTRAMHEYRIYAQFSYSALFMLFGAILLGAGFWRRSQFVRWQALVLLAVAIGKVFLVDVSELSQGYRVLSFLGLGALLLAVSFVYQRDWLHLRSPEHQSL